MDAAAELTAWADQMGGVPLSEHPYVATIPAGRATWDAEQTRLGGASDPAAWGAAGLAAALLAAASADPAAFASADRPPPINVPAGPAPTPPGYVVGPVLGPNRAGYPPVSHLHTVVVGGMPGWQIALIAAAVAAAAVAVIFDRARAGRRHVAAPSA